MSAPSSAGSEIDFLSMHTDGAANMTIDRAVLAFAGTVVLVSVLLTWLVSPWWLLLAAFAGANMVQASFTGFCPAAMLPWEPGPVVPFNRGDCHMHKNWIGMTTELSGALREVRTGEPDVMKGFSALAQAALKAGALDTKTKELIALAISVATRCDACIAFHAEAAVKQVPAATRSWRRWAWRSTMGAGPSVVSNAQAVDSLRSVQQPAGALRRLRKTAEAPLISVSSDPSCLGRGRPGREAPALPSSAAPGRSEGRSFSAAACTVSKLCCRVWNMRFIMSRRSCQLAVPIASYIV